MDLIEYEKSDNISKSSNDSAVSTETGEGDDETLDECDNVDLCSFFNEKEICFYTMINKFFLNCSEENIKKMVEIVNCESNISLRILDWFVTKYSKKRIDCNMNKDVEVFDVRISYKSQLKSYRKKYFDPFRRRKKFKYHYATTETGEKKYVNTTLGQLNFFKWAISNGIINYVEKNLNQIVKAMNISNKEDKKKKIKTKSEELKKVNDTSVSGKRKAIKLSNENTKGIKKNDDSIRINATKSLKNDEIEIVLTFD